MEDQVTTLADQIAELVDARQADGEYTTVRFAAKKFGLKQSDIHPNLPQGYKLVASSNGTLGESRIVLTGEDETEEQEVVMEDGELREGTFSEVELGEQDEKDIEVIQAMLPRKSRRVKVEKEPKVVELDENGNPIPEAEKVICTVCGNPVRKNTIVRRGICPLCFRQLARNVGANATKLEAMEEEEFDAITGEELGRRHTLEDYKASRTLDNDQYKEMASNIMPVKEVFAAAREAGYGPGRVAQAMGGDRFRHEPLGGFGSVWTPYFYGPRKGWFFDKDILNHFDDLAKPIKPKKEKSANANGKTAGVGRKGARGAAMTPVVEEDGANPPDQEMTEEVEETEAEV